MTEVRIAQFSEPTKWGDWQPVEVLMDKAFNSLIYRVRTQEEVDILSGYSIMFGHDLVVELEPTMQYSYNLFSYAYRFLEVR